MIIVSGKALYFNIKFSCEIHFYDRKEEAERAKRVEERAERMEEKAKRIEEKAGRIETELKELKNLLTVIKDSKYNIPSSNWDPKVHE